MCVLIRQVSSWGHKSFNFLIFGWPQFDNLPQGWGVGDGIRVDMGRKDQIL